MMNSGLKKLILGIAVFAGFALSAAASDLVINEVDYDQPGADTSEFIEIKNTGTFAVDLSGIELVLVNGSGGGAVIYDSIVLPAVSLAAGEYFVVCRNSANVANCNFVDNFSIQGGAPDAIALQMGSTIIDTVSYEGDTGAPYTEGSGVGLADSGSTGQDNKGISRFPDGVDTDQNNIDFDFRCISPGKANSSVTSACPLLVINEIDYDQPGSSDTGEFIEIKNIGTLAFDLSGMELVLINGAGGGATIYDSIVLPAVSLAAGDYFVVCGNTVNVANCDSDAWSNPNKIQNGAPDAVALRSGTTIIDTVSYEGNTGAPYTEGSGVGLADSGLEDNTGISRFPDGVDSDRNNVDLATKCISPGNANSSVNGGCTPIGPLVEIFEIQGDGLVSPFADQFVVSNDNVVTALASDGFFMQTPTARSDGDIDTSDGIFVFTGAAPLVQAGDLVDVSGQIQEFFGFTEFAGGTLVIPDGSAAVPPAVSFNSAVPSPDPNTPSCAIEFECYESMLVEIADGTVTGPSQRFGTDPIAEVHIVAAPGRAFREPGILFPGISPLPVWDGNPEVFELDPDKLGLANQLIPAGSTFAASGVLGFEFGGYELWPNSLIVSPAPLPVPVRASTDGEFTVASLNLFRLFDDVDDPADGARNDAVVSSVEYQRRLKKISAYIRDVLRAPDVLAVQEVESLNVLNDLAAKITLDDPAVVYSANLVEGNDVGTIDIGFLSRQSIQVDAITQLGKNETFVDPTDSSVDILHDRPPLLLEGSYQLAFGSFPISIISVHNRSLGGIDSSSDGGRVRQKRYAQAISIAQQAQALQSADPATRLVVLGDFNAFEFSDGYVDTVGIIKGDFDPAANLVCDTNTCPDLVTPDLTDRVLDLAAAERYSFIFAGSAQVLDHALTSQSLATEISGVEYGRGNADAALDLINDETTLLRASDHDGLVVYIQGDADNDGVPNDKDICADTAIPEPIPTVGLKPNHWALVDNDFDFDTVTKGSKGSKGSKGLPQSFTLGDTGGCSCSQIVEKLGLGNGHIKHGCSNGAMKDWVNLVQ